MRHALERIFVINLARRRDRLVKLRAQLRHAGFTAPVEIFRAVDSVEIGPSFLETYGIRIYPGWRIPDAPIFYHAREMKLGEVGCALSHLFVWRRIVDDGLDHALVIEDDADFEQGAAIDIDGHVARIDEHMPQWDLCYVGRKRMSSPPFVEDPAPDEIPIAAGLVRPTFSYNTHAYLLSGRGARKLVDIGYENNIVPVDEFLPALYTRHCRDDLRGIFGPGDVLQAAALVRDLARQRQDGSDVEGSGEVAR
jgi:GR25 family glycosyltransferase involved in LPS biosynthesis